MIQKIAKIGSIIILLLVLSTGCSNNKSKLSQTSNVENVLNQQVAGATNEDSETDISQGDSNPLNDTESDSIEQEIQVADGQSVNIDLTEMGSDMVYATVYQMMVNPDEYIGKKIRMSGQYKADFYEESQKCYHFVIISDATACCEQGIEFVWDNGEHVYPDEYPEENTEVIVSGTFETYSENGTMYCRLSNATMNIVR